MSDFTDVDAFVRLVSMDCPGGPDFVKQRAVLQSAVQFFKETRAWRAHFPGGVMVGAFAPEADLNQVATWVGKHTRVLDIDGCWLNACGTPLKQIHRTMLNTSRPGWRKDTADLPTGYFLFPPRHLRVYPAPSDDAGMVSLDVELVLLPSMEASRLPDFAYDVYGEVICAGAIQRLKSQPGVEWTNPEQARYFLRAYREGIHKARLEKAQRVADAINERRRQTHR